jgi:hypothetical protein
MTLKKKKKYSLGKFEKIGKLLETIVAGNLKGEIQTHKQIFTLWSSLVGEQISKKAEPSKLKVNKIGSKNILFIKLLGPYGPEISLQLEEIKEKINLYYGSDFISKVAFVPFNQFQRLKILDKLSKNDKTEERCQKLIPEILVSDLGLNSALAKLKENLLKRKK